MRAKGVVLLFIASVVLQGAGAGLIEPVLAEGESLQRGFAPAHMPKKRSNDRPKQAPKEARLISLDRAIGMAERQYGGKALSAKPIQGAGPRVYKIKLLSAGGRVSIVFVDAATGDVFKAR